MPAAGIYYQDLLPTPGDTTDYNRRESTQALGGQPSDSHALAVGYQPEKGAAQVEHGHVAEVKDLGWNEPKENIPGPLIGGIPNDDLWMLLRRFNKVRDQVRHIKNRTLTCERLADVPCKRNCRCTSWQPGPECSR